MKPKLTWIRELEGVPQRIVDTLAELNIHTFAEWSEAIANGVRPNLSDADAEWFIRAFWDQVVGLPLKTRITGNYP